MILERSKESSLADYFYVTINDEIYEADALITYPIGKTEFSPKKESVILFFTFVPPTKRKFLFGKHFKKLTKSDYKESNLDSGKPTVGLVFYKGIDFLNKYKEQL